MSRYCIIVILLICLKETKGQATFNIRERYGNEACTITGIVATDSSYYAAGIIADTASSQIVIGSIFLKLDLQGQALNLKKIKGTQQSYETWIPALTLESVGSMFNVGYSISNFDFLAFLAKYGEEGDTVFTKKYLNPYFPVANYITPKAGLATMPDGGFGILCWVETSNDIFDKDTDYYLIRTDSLGNKLWGKVFATPFWERPESVVATPTGSIICGGVRTNQTTNVMDYSFQCNIFQVDSLGNKEWEYLSPISAGLRDAANDMLLLVDGSLIVASGIGHEQQHPSVNEVFFDRYIFKLNPQHQIEWELTFPDSSLTPSARTTNLVKLSDGSGYILAGMEHHPLEYPLYKQPIKGWLAKISPEGDSVWTRRYAFLNNTSMENTIYDVKETPDGGLIICGQSMDWDADALYPQQGWLLKLDEHGCLVPGCHLNDATEEKAPKAEPSIAIYPNPTTDYLNFYIDAPNLASGATIHIINAGGGLVKEFKTSSFNQTFIVPVWDWASGAYWVQLLVEGEVLINEKFIKQ